MISSLVVIILCMYRYFVFNKKKNKHSDIKSSCTYRLGFLGAEGGGDNGHCGRLVGDCAPTTGGATAGAAAKGMGVKTSRGFFLGAAGGDRKGQGRLARGERLSAGGAPSFGKRRSGDIGALLFI